MNNLNHVYHPDDRFAWVEINLDNLDSNLRLIKKFIFSCNPEADNKKPGIMTVVKANAYGHGLLEISKRAIASGSSSLGVALIHEGLRLRNGGIKTPIICIGAHSPEKVKDAVENDICLSITSLNSAKIISGICSSLNKDCRVHVKIDTGMNRIGINYKDAVKDIIEISKIETGNLSVYLKSISMHKMMENVFNQFLLKSEERGIDLKLLQSEDILFESDEKMLSQILTNLISNALKFTKRGSIEINYTIQGNEILFSVKDTGEGILEEHQDKIFSRFYQVNMSMSRGFEGAGLGLSICKGLVETLKGKIWLTSELGKGTTFYFSIPYVKIENLDSESKPAEVTIIKGNKKVLIAEDDEMSFEYLSIILNSHNFDVIRAEDGKAAVDICFERNDIDIVLMDIKMPVMNGLSATKLIKERLPKLPIIAQTAYAFSTEKEVALNAGCDDYVTKPLEKDTLLKVISKYVQ